MTVKTIRKFNVAEDTTPQLGGELDAQAHSIGFTQQAITSTSNEATIDWKAGNKAQLTLSENITTFNFTAPSKPCSLLLKIIQDSTPRTIAWAGTVKWPAATAPTLSIGSGDIDIVSFYYDGTNYYGTFSQDFS